ncbi:16S rRNA (guanine(527)-N(7))-methyltransferase RsmG [Nitrincola sp. MINF-07-Sa-05]|uniref:16S rRNA (guanine(527)-N(7))-methyltransferase RsmG n=1 Tax=Nitrincola salilacus TaxID=3400273 RepID=UPI0039181F9C
MQEYRSLLSSRLKGLGLDLSSQQQEQLLNYLALLVKWNKAFNLTAIRDPEQMIDRHLVDSLSIMPHVPAGRLLDVGSGAGLPGIPLAICRPDLQVTTLDSNGKKTRFQLQAKAELKLENLNVINSRVEQYQVDPFDSIVSRAFASLRDMLEWTGHLCAESGVFLAMKGLYPEQELNDLPAGYVLKDSHRLDVPGTEGERHLLILGRA